MPVCRFRCIPTERLSRNSGSPLIRQHRLLSLSWTTIRYSGLPSFRSSGFPVCLGYGLPGKLAYARYDGFTGRLLSRSNASPAGGCHGIPDHQHTVGPALFIPVSELDRNTVRLCHLQPVIGFLVSPGIWADRIAAFRRKRMCGRQTVLRFNHWIGMQSSRNAGSPDYRRTGIIDPCHLVRQL
jgi:hypothetical protein